jgi:hypothetical protein
MDSAISIENVKKTLGDRQVPEFFPLFDIVIRNR